MTEILPWIVGVFVLAVLVYYLWQSMNHPEPETHPEDRYHHALEAWLEGDLEKSSQMLRDLVHEHPSSIDPYLQLGNLLRLQGDFEKAAVLHRGLTVRSDLSRAKKVTVGLALAEDLLELEQFDAAREILDTLIRDASGKTRYWKSRFRHWHGSGQFADAARALKQGQKSVAKNERPYFSAAYTNYQLDRALQHVRRGENSDARARLKDVKGIPEGHSRSVLVQAMLAAADADPAKALTLAAEDLFDHPEELSLFLPMLQQVLLESGQYSRTLPILERACQSEHAPPSLWIDLALLYEKLGNRDKTLRLLETKTGRSGFTPDVAAPLLKLLVNDASDTDFARVWKVLDKPAEIHDWKCHQCGHIESEIRWFCDQCHSFDSFVAQIQSLEGH